jgi:mannose-6-phosphate isomerase-like protein (cupin superfamily)
MLVSVPFRYCVVGLVWKSYFMKSIRLAERSKSFQVLGATRSCQAASMTLKPGESTGEMQNEHPRCEQWLFVISGSGTVSVPRRRIRVRARSLVLIEKSERHQVKNTGRDLLVTISFYCPPAYTDEGEPKPSATRKVKN